jgi:hypothetical protein
VDLRLVWNPDHLGGTAAAKGRKLFSFVADAPDKQASLCKDIRNTVFY